MFYMLVLSLRKKHSSCLSNKVLPCTGGQEPISPSLMKTEKIPDCMWKHFHKLFMIWKRDKSNQHYCCIAVMTVCAICKSGITAKISFLFSWGKLQGWAAGLSWDAELRCRAEMQGWAAGLSCRPWHCFGSLALLAVGAQIDCPGTIFAPR